MKYLGAPQSGSQSNTTASRNRYGQYYRTRATPVNPSSGAQASVRATLSNAATGWGMLTSAQRLAWNDYAQTHPTVDSLGQTIFLTGANTFVQFAAIASIVQETPLVLPPGPPSFASGNISLASAAGPTLTITGPEQPVGYFAILYCSPYLSPGVSFPPTQRVITFVNGDELSGNINIAALVADRWGPLVTGKRLIIDAKLVSDEFVQGPRLRATVVIAGVV